jgi:predicted dehydrogenase
MSDILSVGVIGAGGIAHSHVEGIRANANIRLAAVMDIDGERAEALAGPNHARSYTRLEDLLEDPDVEAVHVCSVHNVHKAHVVAAAKAGKHVLVEKPMALSVAECDQMIRACESAGVVLMVGQVMRKYPVNLKIRQIIADGTIGTVGHMIRRRYSYFNPTQPGQGYRPWYLDADVGGICVLYCFGPHEFDILPWYIDSPVVQVYAQGSMSTELYHDQRDSYSMIMTHDQGAISTLTQTVVNHTSAHDTHIIGSEGSMFLTNRSLMVNGEEIDFDQNSNRLGMPNQIGEFAECCLQGKVPDASGRSVRHTMAMIEAAKLSAERNAPVKLSELDEE